MVRVENIDIKISNFHKEFDNLNNKDMQKCIRYLKLDDKDPKQLLTSADKLTVMFDLNDTNVSIANGIRRCLTNEIETYSLSFDEHNDMHSTDVYILNDQIKKQIELVPINQEYDYGEHKDYEFVSDLKISLFVENKSDANVDITTNDIKILDKNNKVIPSEKIINQNILLTRLRPGVCININNINITSGLGITDAGKFSLLASIYYKPLDANPLKEEQFSTTGVSSMVTNSTKYRIGYSTHRNFSNPLTVMVLCCDTLINRLEIILLDLKNISNKDDYYFSDLLELETKDNIKKLSIKGEYWTIINMISKFCYILSKGNIKYISSSIIHPEKNIGVINIIHTEFSTLIQNAIKEAIAELHTIKKAFK